MLEPGRYPSAIEDVYRLIVENAADMIVRGDAARNRTYVSPASREILGYEPEELLGKNGLDLVHPDDLERVEIVFSRIGSLFPSQDVRFRMRRANGTYVWIDARYRHLPADNGVLALLRDITAQKEAEEQLAEAHAKLAAANAVLQRLALVDGLTGLANRRQFDAMLDEEVGRSRRSGDPVALVLLDLDHFKAFNDSYGHLRGDDCLRRVSHCVQEMVNRPGDLVARYGGEEIAVVLPATDLSGAIEVGERICAGVRALKIRHSGSALGVVTVSGGAASLCPPRRGNACTSLIDAADKALYRAKAAGRNCVRGGVDAIPAGDGVGEGALSSGGSARRSAEPFHG